MHKRVHQIAEQTRKGREDRRNKEKAWKEKGRRKAIRAKLYPLVKKMQDLLYRMELAEFHESSCLNAFVGAAESDPTFSCE